jgi:hypothetical protein
MRVRTIAGVVLLIGALSQASIAAYILLNAHDPETRMSIAWRKSDEACEATLQKLGTLEKQEKSIRIFRTLLENEDWRVVLMDISSAISQCSTRQMTYFCMGRDCNKMGAAGILDEGLANQTVLESSDENPEAFPVKVVLHMKEVNR